MSRFRGFSCRRICAPTSRIPTLIIALLFIISLLTTPVHAVPYSFQGLGDLQGGIFASAALAISADGSVVVGQGYSGSDIEAFRWTSAGGMVGLGELPGGTYISVAYAVSADGEVVVGQSNTGSVVNPAFRWTSAGGMVSLGDLPGGNVDSLAYGASADGAVVVGSSSSAESAGFRTAEAFRWTIAGGMVGLGDLPAGDFNSVAHAVSADGAVVVGAGSSASGSEEAFHWTSAGGMIGLGDLSGGLSSSEARGVSADGIVVVGYGYSASGREAFRWTSAGGMVGLGALPGGGFSSTAYDVSADGSVVVGSSQTDAPFPSEAFRWTEGAGMVNLKDFLIANGVTNLDGWFLSRAEGVSADGRTIVGFGRNPSGNTEAWIVRVCQTTRF